MAQRNSWLRGTTIRKSGPSTAASTRTGTPTQVQSTSTTIFGGGVKDPSGRTSEYFSMDDQCPVCKSDRYLNPKLRLLVSACYHKMCESCIDRLYTLGPAPCPICNKILRKLAFTPQTFEDLTVEKEVAVRRRIAKEFNKRMEDFPDLRAYNDYLEWVEEITFNLINDIDVAETEARIRQYRQENAALIELNIKREEEYQRYLQEQEEAERQERELRAQELRRLEEEEREEREKAKQGLIDKLEMSDKDAARLVAKSRAEAQKRASARAASSSSFSQSSARLLRSRAAQSTVIPDVPHVPLQDNYYAYDDLFTMRDTYYDPVSEAVRKDREGIMRAGGYMVEQAWQRALRCAVAGLEIAPLTGVPAPPQEAMAIDSESSADVVMANA
ncbi:CDK-activating kinase assembly factor [Dichomitus squalens LYAD-421 SS1]|uniref:RNA polymerase II transcription factor B subunit 3 n=1 Tax=Dichomitus squalens TaxID=114155 RepID=A0A4Q9QFC8_9APHY|nr:CDK-activating kinase assembly factor [Dichomitus squalens LYAD-421 SS1]EJF65719.1 CDK-activating kinase assembly factor [Dichomitus squalens LYAD-421 SS1]TBU65996.1 CDK-activating kinase assembly factor [Dichomitus squalens]